MPAARWSALALALAMTPLSMHTACQVLVPLEAVPQPPEAAAPDVVAVVDASDAEVFDPCSERPPRPSTRGGSETLNLVFGYVATSPSELDAPGWPLCANLGFDLDDKKTCLDDEYDAAVTGGSCANVSDAGTLPPLCDEKGGIDNAAGQLLDSITGALGNVDRETLRARSALRRGTRNVLMRVSNYNGEADDGDVTVSFFLLSGTGHSTWATLDEGGIAAGSFDAWGPPTPSAAQWDGRSLREWYVDPSTRTEIIGAQLAPLPELIARSAYVANHLLVVEADQMPMPFSVGKTLRLRNAKLSGELRRTTNRDWSVVNGRVGGTIEAKAVLRSVFSSNLAELESGLCAPKRQGFAAFVKSRVCAARDFPGQDATTCGSLTLGASFVAVTGLIGSIRESDENVVECDVPGIDFDASDPCSQ